MVCLIVMGVMRRMVIERMVQDLYSDSLVGCKIYCEFNTVLKKDLL